jgi:hypothetical protein
MISGFASSASGMRKIFYAAIAARESVKVMKKGFLLVLILFVCFFMSGSADAAMSTKDFEKLCESGTPQDVEAAIKGGALVNPDLRDSDMEDPFSHLPLMTAVENNPDPEVVSVLLKNNAELDARTFDGYTPLIVAVRKSKPKFVRLLLENGADANDSGYYGISALMYACMEPNLEIASLLLDNGADIDYPMDNAGDATVLMLAARESESPELVSFLLDNDADAELTDNDGKTALDYAAENENLKDTDVYRRLEVLTKGAGEKSEEKSGSIVLYPKDADLSEAPDVIVEGNPQNLGGWKSDNAVVFRVNVKDAGMYSVVLFYSKQESDGDEAKLTVSARGGSVAVSNYLPATGNDWSNYEEHMVAGFDMPAGESALRFASSEPDGRSYVMNLRSVTLTPEEEE